MAQVPTLSIAQRWEIADRYFAEGCELIKVADRQWTRAHDASVDADFRRVARHNYEITAAKVRTRFRRHDLQLDLIARDQAVLDANAEPAREDTAP